MPLFHPRVLEKHIKHVEPMPDNHAVILNTWAENLSKGIYNSETQNDGEFIQRILIDVLGYIGSSEGQGWTVAKNQPVGKGNVDVALGNFSAEKTEIKAPFELKGAKTKDLDAIMAGRNKTPVQQAWEYAMDVKGAQWVLVSNYREIRLYAVGYGRKDHESFDLSKLSKPQEYARFILLLSADNLLSGKTQGFLKESEQVDKDITNQLYADYKGLRAKLIKTIGEDNPDKDPLEIIRFTQTILDRILFIAFAEDKGLLPENTLKQAYETKNLYSPQPVWENFKGLFDAINKGNADLNIPGYNGGLFADEPELNCLCISDELCEGFKKIGEYDFESDVSVNILGHIFEQSISDLEELKAHVENIEQLNKKLSKRKKDGIFYTPAYITRYIVEQAIGGWLKNRKNDLGFNNLPDLSEEDFDSIKFKDKGKHKGQIIYNKKVGKHIQMWEAYKEVLSNIKVLDPACGSGAFLNEVFDYLKSEGEMINGELAILKGEQKALFQWDTHILANNIYGVDLNSESIEITKLSLWLKTANRQEKLTYLEDNIKVGNSIIADPDIAGELSFNWQTEFAEIIENGGFDVIVGNPPYGANLSAIDKEYIEKRYPSFRGNHDIYSAFIDQAFNICKKGGFWGFITPVSWQSGFNYQQVRENIKQNGTLVIGIKLPYDTFSDAYVDTGIYIVNKQKNTDYISLVYDFPIRYKIFGSLEQEVSFQELPSLYWQNLESLKIVFNPSFYSLSEKARRVGVELMAISDSVRGILADKSDILETPNTKTKPYFTGNAYRYELQPGLAHVRYGENLKEKPKDYKFFEKERILIRRLINRQLRVMGLIVKEEFVNKKDLYNLIVTDSNYEIGYLLSVINSKLTSFLMTKGSTASTKDDFSQITLNDIRTIRIPKASNDKQLQLAEKAQNIQFLKDNLHKKIKSFLKLFKSEFDIENTGRKLNNWFELEFSGFAKEIEKKIKPLKLSLSQKSEWMQHFEKEKSKALELKNRIDLIDQEIDEKVYELYELTPEEIKLIEISEN